MNTTFLTWMAVAAVVGGALLLFLGMPAADQELPLALQTVTTESAQISDATAYWEPASSVVTTPMAVPVAVHYASTNVYGAQACGACGTTRPRTAAPVTAYQSYVQPCGSCGSTAVIQRASVPPCPRCGASQPSYRQPGERCGSCGTIQRAIVEQMQVQHCSACGSSQTVTRVPASAQRVETHACTSCGWVPVSPYADAPVSPLDVHTCSSCGSSAHTSAVPIHMQYPQVASCEQRVPSPCGATMCSPVPMNCGSPCGNTCPLDKPGINRNMDLCVEECTFVQLHTTMPHPVCSDVRFEWTTSKGSFLETNVADPIYYVPTTQFADGEDVWVVVKITDSSGATYTDQLKLHVINQR
jgi:hypothetical protein